MTFGRYLKFPQLRRGATAFLLAAAAVFALAGGAFAPEARAASSEWHQTDQTAARLISAETTVGDRDKLQLGLHFTMQPGWKIYWRSPGDAGFPPRPIWDQSENVASAEIAWPVPLRFEVLGLQTLGYEKEVVFPVSVTVEDPSKPVNLKARVPYLTCDDICIPYEAELSLNLPAGSGNVTEFTHVISGFDAKVPGDPRRHGLEIQPAVQILDPVDGDKASARLRFAARADAAFDAPDLYLEGDELLSFSKPEVVLSDDGRSVQMDVRVFGAEDLDNGLASLEGADVVATLVDGVRTGEQPVTLSRTASLPAAHPATGTETSLALILLFAVLGGLILNLMPCVLPVLSIKLLGVVGHGGGDKREVRFGFLAAAAGIFAAFGVLAGGLIALQTGGMQLGWGIQFQQPWFLAALAVIVTAFACNLWGWFEVTLPETAGDLALKHSSHGGMKGHFLQGALATLLATPCSAPFLGTAIGFALSRGSVEIGLIFAGVALGLALPYLMIAAFPGFATALPKPGPWMNKLKAVLGLALAATAVWLLSVLLTSAGAPATIVTATLLTALAAALYLRKQGTGPFRSKGAAAAVALGLAAVIAVEVVPAPTSSNRAAETADGIWQPFDAGAIPGLVAGGKTVFVDVTADWCITCQVNKKAVLDRGGAQALLNATNTIAMRADWTRPDMKIADYLASFGRFGIPFNVVYGPEAPNGIPLPELLTQDAVSAAFGQADDRHALASR